MAKSYLVKSLGLHYEEHRKPSMDVSPPRTVFCPVLLFFQMESFSAVVNRKQKIGQDSCCWNCGRIWIFILNLTSVDQF